MEAGAKTNWTLDPAHSELTFTVKHMMFANVKGQFKDFSITIDGDDLFQSNVVVTIDAASIDTNNADKDNHFRAADFFDEENHQKITFKSISFHQKQDDEYVIKGILILKSIGQEVSIDASFGGINIEAWGNEKAGLSINGKINRKDWGQNWNAALETGGVLVSKEVKISDECQFGKTLES